MGRTNFFSLQIDRSRRGVRCLDSLIMKTRRDARHTRAIAIVEKTRPLVSSVRNNMSEATKRIIKVAPIQSI